MKRIRWIPAAAAAMLLSPSPGTTAPAPPAQEAITPAGARDQDRGLWFGTMALCRDTVESARVDNDSFAHIPTFIVSLKPHAQSLLLAETERLIGKKMSIRLDGRMISEPIVREPISSGNVQIIGQTLEDIALMQKASLQPC